MIFRKIIYHICANLKKIIYKMIYGRKISFGIGVTWRKRMDIYIEGGKIRIGNNCFFNHNCSLASMELIEIGDDCLFGENVHVYDHNHRFSNPNISIKNQGYSKNKVVIGNHCWIGSNVVILKGVTIGDNCVISAGVVVRENVPSNMILKNPNHCIYIPIKNEGVNVYE